MTATLADPVRAAAPAETVPAARRLGRSRRVDPRLVAGIVLLLVSIVAGDRLLTSGRATTPVLVATRDLAAGHVLAPGDLVAARVRLSSAARPAYLPATTPLTGRVLARAVGTGELLPAAAIGAGAAAPARLVAVAVADGHRPLLSAGDVVDLYVTTSRAGAACTTIPAVRGVEVADDVPVAATSGSATVVLRVPVGQAAAVVLAAASGALDIVVTRGAAPTPPDAVTGSSPCAAR